MDVEQMTLREISEYLSWMRQQTEEEG